MNTQRGIKLETAAVYEIRIQGYLDQSQFRRIRDADILVEHAPDSAPVTVLIGTFIDQAALAGALNLLYDLGFPLLSVQCLGRID
jgi:hypothetical protein